MAEGYQDYYGIRALWRLYDTMNDTKILFRSPTSVDGQGRQMRPAQVCPALYVLRSV